MSASRRILVITGESETYATDDASSCRCRGTFCQVLRHDETHDTNSKATENPANIESLRGAMDGHLKDNAEQENAASTDQDPPAAKAFVEPVGKNNGEEASSLD